MLILRGTLRAATQLGGGTNRKTGEVIPLRDVLQVETLDNRGLVQVNTITVPDHKLCGQGRPGHQSAGSCLGNWWPGQFRV